ncbi:hypothetical protein PR202_gb18834 [Eleusine coracana subsp. coracana]|uniref:RING-type E3 ubiquitin transferase n=1 Tax=Eleusine coracana subsp. coracana TaxID=191504 RepID=A0AAV5F6N6_ELECO|nr:hypothetical protein QOZ80_3BG0291370 [Eleusine coracana subsp. coracana]GJN30521.1 hypothetical protein PR202_gb18834 [Eleusine coracana subsp. coracana]
MDRRRITAPALLVLVLLLSTAAVPSLAQQSSNGTTREHHSRTTGGFTPTTVIVLVVLIGAFFILTFFSIYINRCAPPRPSPPRRASIDHQDAADGAAAPRPARGLDRELVESFPTAVYGDVKARVAATARSSLECAVCLAEFEDRDELRVLPACCHVFHPACIDPWLAAAVTCPLCRADLTPAPPAPPESRDAPAVVLEEEEDEECLVGGGAFTPESLISFGAAARPHEFHYRRTQSALDAPDRHTLRLPEHVMKELAAVRTHRRAASLAGYPDAAAERTPRWLASFWRSVSWQRQSRAEASDAGEEHGGSKRVVPITESSPEERPSASGSGGGEKEDTPDDDALNRV